jgi:hypothetical protein
MTAPARAIAALAPIAFIATVTTAAVFLSSQPKPSPVPAPWPYREKIAMVQRNVLVRAEGRLDHMAFDPRSNHLYVAAIRNGTLEVHHTPDSTTTQSIELPEPSGVLFIPEGRRLAVSCTGDNSVHLFRVADDGTLTAERTVGFDGPTGNMVLDAVSGRVFVAHANSLGSFDPATGERGRDTDLGGIAQGVVVEPRGEKRRLFVNVASKQAVVVVDAATHAVSATWPLEPVPDPASSVVILEANHALALDHANNRLFVATRVPAKLIVLDTTTGAPVAEIAGICKDADDCWYDPVARRVLITGGGGAGGVTGVRQNGPDDYAIEFATTTASGARTSFFSPDTRRLYVAAPAFGQDQAYIFVYEMAPPTTAAPVAPAPTVPAAPAR